MTNQDRYHESASKKAIKAYQNAIQSGMTNEDFGFPSDSIALEITSPVLSEEFPIRKAPQYLADLIKKGWVLFPLRPKTKLPYKDYHWTKTHCKTQEELETSFAQYSDCNWAVHLGLSKLVVLDIDNKGTKDGNIPLAEYEAIHGKLPQTVEAKTGSGGRHRYFYLIVPEGKILKSDDSQAARGLEIISGNNYVVLTPCSVIHPETKELQTYEWIHSPDDFDIREAPEWLANKVLCDAITAKPVEQVFSPTTVEEVLATKIVHPKILRLLEGNLNQGERNNAFRDIAREFNGQHIPEADCRTHLLPIALKVGTPEAELFKTIASMYKTPSIPLAECIAAKEEKLIEEYKQKFPAVSIPEDYDYSVINPIPLEDSYFHSKIIAARNFFQDDWNRRNGIIPKKETRPTAMAFSLLAVAKSIVGKRRYFVTDFVGTRLYCGNGSTFIIAPSGSGKTPIYNFANALAVYCQLKQFTMDSSWPKFLEDASDYYCQAEIKNGKKIRKPSHEIKDACIKGPKSSNGICAASDEVAKSLSALLGNYSAVANANWRYEGKFIESLEPHCPDFFLDSRAKGNEFNNFPVYDPCFSYFGITTDTDMIKNIDPLGEERRKTGFFARLGLIVENPAYYNFDSMDLDNNKSTDLQILFAPLKQAFEYSSRLEIQAVKQQLISIEALDFKEHASSWKAFMEQEAELFKSIRNKIENQAICDAMLYALLDNSTDIQPYYENCLKARTAATLNTYLHVSSLKTVDFDSKILKVFAKHRTPQTAIAKSAIAKQILGGVRYDSLDKETIFDGINHFETTGTIVMIKSNNRGGRYYMPRGNTNGK